MGRPAPENLVLLATGDGQWEGTTQDFSFFEDYKKMWRTMFS